VKRVERQSVIINEVANGSGSRAEFADTLRERATCDHLHRPIDTFTAAERFNLLFLSAQSWIPPLAEDCNRDRTLPNQQRRGQGLALEVEPPIKDYLPAR
jgi:hypothetical protein